MAKTSALQKAISELDADIAVLQAAKLRLIQQQKTQAVRRPRAVPAPREKVAGE